MNGDVRLAWWVVTVPARFVYGVAVGWSRLRFGDPDPQPAQSDSPALNVPQHQPRPENRLSAATGPRNGRRNPGADPTEPKETR